MRRGRAQDETIHHTTRYKPMNTEQAAPFQQQLITLRRQVLDLLSSMRFAIALLTVICIASVIGTVLKLSEPLREHELGAAACAALAGRRQARRAPRAC